jgi:Phage tail tube protein
MASTGVLNGTAIKLSIGGSTVAYLTSNDLGLSTAMRDITSKDSAGDAEYAPGLRTATLSCKVHHVEGATEGFSTMFAAWKAGTLLAFVETSVITGDKKYSGNCYVKDLKKTSPMNANVEVDITFQVTGAIAEASV